MDYRRQFFKQFLNRRMKASSVQQKHWRSATNSGFGTTLRVTQATRSSLIAFGFSKDDFKQCGLNDASGIPKKFTLHGVDYFIAASLIRALVLRDEGLKVVLKGKTFDPKSAYKQYPLHPADQAHLRIAIREPGSNSPMLFGLNSLPFGATGSVVGFLRISAALFYILSVGLKVWCSAFFDDFPTMSVDALTNSTDKYVGLLFDMLGIQFATEGKKCHTLGTEMKALGLVFDLSQFDEGLV